MHIHILGENQIHIYLFFISKLASNQTTYVLLFTYMLCLCAVVVSLDLSEYTFLDRMTDNTFIAHIQRIHNPMHSMYLQHCLIRQYAVYRVIELCIRRLCASHGSTCKCHTISFVQLPRCKYLLNSVII